MNFNNCWVDVRGDIGLSKKVEESLLALGYKIAYDGVSTTKSHFSPFIWIRDNEFHSTANSKSFGTKTKAKDIFDYRASKVEIGITDEDEETMNILGFKCPLFECEIFFTDRLGVIHGRVGNDSIRWNKKGLCFTHPDNFNLTPVKPKWYEDEANFPALITDGEVYEFAVRFEIKEQRFYFGKGLYSNICNDWKLATKAERDSLYCEGE